MDSINFRNINVEKAKAIRKHRQLQKLTSLFWVLEICLVLALISTFFIQLPISLKNCCKYFKNLTVILVSPCFVFVLGNIIVITLCASSSEFAGRQYHTGKSSSRTDLYEEFIANSDKCHDNEAKNGGKLGTNVEHVVTEMSFGNFDEKRYQRSRSDNLRLPKQNTSSWELRRPVTEKCMASVYSSTGLDKITYPEDNICNEEFRCIIEAFIERQKRFRKDEENSAF